MSLTLTLSRHRERELEKKRKGNYDKSEGARRPEELLLTKKF
jgi:hypothetical protein